MPPKRQVEKKEEEVVDLSNLPAWNCLIVLIEWHQYLKEIQQQFQPGEYVLVTRDELESYAKEKGIFTPESQDDQIEAFQLAKALKDKIFHTDLAARKAKMQNKVGDQKNTEVPDLGLLKPDSVYLLSDFPVNEEEVEAVEVQGLSIHLSMYLKPEDRIVLERNFCQVADYESSLLNNKKQEVPQIPKKYPGGFVSLQDKQHRSLKNQGLKHTQFQIKTLLDVQLPVVPTTPAADLDPKRQDPRNKQREERKGKGREEKKEEVELPAHVQQFLKDILIDIDRLGRSWVGYRQFLKSIKLLPLLPVQQQEEEKEEQKSQDELFIETVSPTIPAVNSQDDIEYEYNLSSLFSLIQQTKCELISPEFIASCCLLQTILDLNQHQDQYMNLYFQHKLMSLLKENFDTDFEELNQIIDVDEIQQIVDFSDTFGKQLFNENFPNLNIQINPFIKNILSYCKLPGIDRHQMPQQPEKSQAIRGAEKSELVPFSSLPIEEFEKANLITQLEQSFKKSSSERDWDFSDRIYEQQLDKTCLIQQIYNSLLLDPDLVMEYYSAQDYLLLGAYFKAPPGRILRKQWKYPQKVFPSFTQWTNISDQFPVQEYLDIDADKVGNIKERTKIFMPADNSVFKQTEFTTGPRIHEECFRNKSVTSRFKQNIIKDNVILGLHPNYRNQTGEIWGVFNDNTRFLAELEDKQCNLTLTTHEGLMIKFLPSGDILQQKSCEIQNSCLLNDLSSFDQTPVETNRVITGMGTVIRYMSDNTIELLLPNGNISRRSRDKVWISTNNKGMQRARREKDGLQYDEGQITANEIVDPETQSKVIIRSDLTKIIYNTDNSTIAAHHDGTHMFVSPDKNTVFVKSPGFATVKIHRDKLKARQNTVIGLGSADSGLGVEDLMMRSNNGRITETMLSDGSSIFTFHQIQESEGYDEFIPSTVHVLYGADKKVMKVDSLGEVVFITGQARLNLQEKSSDDAYFYELFTVSEDRSSGVYTGNCVEGKIWTRDHEGNFFSMDIYGKMISQLAVSLSNEDEIQSPQFSEDEFVEEECRFLPPPSTIQHPRLFVIRNDSTGFELLNEEQVKDQELSIDMGKKYNSNDTNVWIKQEGFKEVIFANYKQPNQVGHILQTHIIQEYPQKTKFVFRKLSKTPEFTLDKREQFEDDLKRYKEWKQEQEKQRQEYKLSDKRTEAQLKKEQELVELILKMRGLYIEESVVETSEDEFYRMDSTPDESEHPGSEES